MENISLAAPFITPKENLGSAPVFTTRFTLSALPDKATLKITGLGIYRAFINGERVGEDYLTPGYNDYNAYLRFKIYDVTPHLTEGENIITVFVGDGWYKGRFGPGPNRFGDKYLLSAELNALLKNSERICLKTGEEWSAFSSGCIENSIYDGEITDYNLLGKYKCGVALFNTEFKLEPDEYPPVAVKHIIKPTLIISPKGEQILDFEQNITGFVRFTGHYKKDTAITLSHGEILQDECFYNDNYRTARAEAKYISDGKIHCYEPMFTYFGFRYVRVEGLEKISPEDFEGIVIYSDLKETLTCVTDNDKINRLILNSIWGQRDNFVDVPTDCPQRDERKGWTGDTQVYMTTACYHMDCRDFYKKFIRDTRAEQTLYYNGDIPKFVPSNNENPSGGGAVWADAATIIPWNLYKFYGDKALLEYAYPLMRDYTEVLLKRAVDEGTPNLIQNFETYGDWLAQDGSDPLGYYGGTDHGFISSVYYYYSVLLTANAANVLDYSKDSDFLSKRAEEIHNAICEKYIDKDGNFILDTQTALILALKHGIYKDKQVLKNRLKNKIKDFDYKVMTGFTGTPLILPVLFENGMSDEAFKILYNEEFPGWLYTVNLGATTIWERWNSVLPDGKISGTDMNSLNHYTNGSVCEAIYAYIAGLRPNFGWKNYIIEPHFNPLMKNISIKYLSDYGEHSVEWQTMNGRATVKIHVPPKCTADLTLNGINTKLFDGEHIYTVDV